MKSKKKKKTSKRRQKQMKPLGFPNLLSKDRHSKENSDVDPNRSGKKEILDIMNNEPAFGDYTQQNQPVITPEIFKDKLEEEHKKRLENE